MMRSIVLSLALMATAIPFTVVTAHTATCASSPAPHSYVAGANVGVQSSILALNSKTATPDGESVGLTWPTDPRWQKHVTTPHGAVIVTEGNTADCDGDGVPFDYDGDYETGIGGGFFGYGPWANEATCQYGLRLHGGVVNVFGLLSTDAFVTGADDQSGPIVIPDVINGGNICETDGSITPGDPAVDPAADADDCLSPIFVFGSGSACGAGGDGGYWVIILTAAVDADSLSISAVPTAGFIIA